ncbi:hypothetical protein FRC08_014401 [Ceratobasidium sp. 394]|nr:hypothetical protein FRC08_014401 [Ceratobasidium sp. 394]
MTSTPAFGSYNFGASVRNYVHGGSTVRCQPNGSPYNLVLGNWRFTYQTNDKLGGFHGMNYEGGDISAQPNQFVGARLEDLEGEILTLCKNQHGCRYLQKKLEEGVPTYRDIIFYETFSVFANLMIDPFGNYLCQKIFQYSTDEQRTAICKSIAHDLVGISSNMHGTRALQTIIGLLPTRRQANPSSCGAQVRSITTALGTHIAALIKDPRGNYVIQECLNRLTPEDNQRIHDAIVAHCIEIAAHPHGCCILQRCIEHGSNGQRIQLITEIIFHTLTLVRDPYGNYLRFQVVQYILSLDNNHIRETLFRQFVGNVCTLAVQKFSSNVIEQCIRVATGNSRELLVEEFVDCHCLEELLCDSFGNYCVQTALDYATPVQRMLLIKRIRPIFPLIQHTPWGKRIQHKLEHEQMESHCPRGGVGMGGPRVL